LPEDDAEEDEVEDFSDLPFEAAVFGGFGGRRTTFIAESKTSFTF